ncbi:unnamed protein product [Toxocara canis]|uniref:Caprin-1_dimer domain-containing protein n=1 Tax=Toxocara canis TaxID=6265 RepID=A0A183V2K9_TOXCA|nr:unnamed protein product [Toxocara canis]
MDNAGSGRLPKPELEAGSNEGSWRSTFRRSCFSMCDATVKGNVLSNPFFLLEELIAKKRRSLEIRLQQYDEDERNGKKMSEEQHKARWHVGEVETQLEFMEDVTKMLTTSMKRCNRAAEELLERVANCECVPDAEFVLLTASEGEEEEECEQKELVMGSESFETLKADPKQRVLETEQLQFHVLTGVKTGTVPHKELSESGGPIIDSSEGKVSKNGSSPFTDPETGEQGHAEQSQHGAAQTAESVSSQPAGQHYPSSRSHHQVSRRAGSGGKVSGFRTGGGYVNRGGRRRGSRARGLPYVSGNGGASCGLYGNSYNCGPTWYHRQSGLNFTNDFQ